MGCGVCSAVIDEIAEELGLDGDNNDNNSQNGAMQTPNGAMQTPNAAGDQKSCYEMLRGYDDYAEEILQYTRTRAPHKWSVVKRELYNDMSEEEKAETTEEEFNVLGDWLGAANDDDVVAHSDWVRVFAAAAEEKVFDISKIPTLQHEMKQIEKNRKEEEQHQADWGKADEKKSREDRKKIDDIRKKQMYHWETVNAGGAVVGKPLGNLMWPGDDPPSEKSVHMMQQAGIEKGWIPGENCKYLQKVKNVGYFYEEGTESGKAGPQTWMMKKSNPELEQKRRAKIEAYEKKREAWYSKSAQQREKAIKKGLEWPEDASDSVKVEADKKSSGGYMHHANPQAQLFIRCNGEESPKVKIVAKLEGKGEFAKPTGTMVVAYAGEARFAGERIVDGKRPTELARAVYICHHTSRVEIDLKKATKKVKFSDGSEGFLIRLLMVLQRPNWQGLVKFSVAPVADLDFKMVELKSVTELAAIERENERKSLECRDLIDGAKAEGSISFCGMDLGKQAVPILLEYDPVYDIIERCEKEGKKFIDPDFPPCDDSLRPLSVRKPRNAENNPDPRDRGSPWARVEKFHSYPDVFVGGVQVDDMCQGSIGNCWFIGILSGLGRYQDIINALIEPNRWNPQGVYSVRIYMQSKKRWYYIIVDDFLPASRGAPLYVRSKKNNGEFWMCLLEKAMAKVGGSYAKLRGGGGLNQEQVSNSYSGFNCHAVHMNNKDRSPNDLFNRAMLAERGKAVIVGCSNYPKSRLDVDMKGIVRLHAYAVIGGYEGNGIRLLKLRNTWGQGGEWKGDWSDKSKKWEEHPEIKEGVGAISSNDGIFFMTPEDAFSRYMYFVVSTPPSNLTDNATMKLMNTLGSTHNLDEEAKESLWKPIGS